MRIVNGLIALLLLLFAAVQYNDPDFYLWIPIYLIPAILAAIAAFRPRLLARKLARAALYLCLAAAAGGTIYAWPTSEGWWLKEVWWEDEVAREGMGLMIVTISLFVVAASNWRSGRRSSLGR